MSQPAVVNYSSESDAVELRDVNLPDIGEDDVLLRVAAVSVCGSDLHQWKGSASWPVNYPVVLGHEFCGVIERMGSRVTGWKVDDRVVSETAAVINPTSAMSRQGLYNLDPERLGFGYGTDGAMTKYVKVASRLLHRLPDHVSFEHAALTEPCCVAYNAVVNNSSIKPGDRIVVLGPGPIGLLCAKMAKLRGAHVGIVGLERDRGRLAVAASFGCTPIVEDPAPFAREVDGLGADGVIDAAGVSITLKTAIDIVRPNGWITKVGWGPQPLGFNLDPLVIKNVRLQGSFSHNWPVWERVIGLMASGELDMTPLIGGIWGLEDWRIAFDKMKSGEIVKAVLKPA